MSKDTIERQLDIVIHLLENLPRKICDEMDTREEVKRHQEREKNLLAIEMETNANCKMDDKNGRVKPMEKTLKRKEI